MATERATASSAPNLNPLSERYPRNTMRMTTTLLTVLHATPMLPVSKSKMDAVKKTALIKVATVPEIAASVASIQTKPSDVIQLFGESAPLSLALCDSRRASNQSASGRRVEALVTLRGFVLSRTASHAAPSPSGETPKRPTP